MLFRVIVSILLTQCWASRLETRDLIDDQAAQFVADYSNAAALVYRDNSNAAWNYQTNITDYNQQAMIQSNLDAAEFTLDWGQRAKAQFSSEVIAGLQDEAVRRQLEQIVILGTANLSPAEQNEYNRITSEMESVYSQAKATLPDGSQVPLDPDLTNIMATSRDYEYLKAAWKGWYEAAGRPIKDDYEQFVQLSNKASVADGFEDTGDYWRSWYEVEDLGADMERLWNELQPLYKELHAFVRRKLYEQYGPDYINLNAPIPAHLLGNMWAQQWGNIFDLLEPYPGKAGVDATPGMVEQGYDAMRMFKVSEEFFTSVNLEPMTQKFWNRTMYVRPDDGREVTCHASAWDFYDGDDFRVKMCTQVNMDDLITVHHEMGHIQYFQQYKDQPVPFRGGANPGFHEAVGDTLSLSVSTPAHLYSIGLLDSVDEGDPEADINYLLSQALNKIAFLPFGYMIDQWRWKVFDGSVSKAQYQKTWDDLRLQYQGIIPPVERDEVLDFDPGAKYHIPANTPYIRYFVSFVLQFQFYKAMCVESGHTGPLYQCDFYKSTAAGAKLASMLQLGSSKPWPIALEAVTGSPDMSTSALQEYFEPLATWLKEQNQKNGDLTGWSDTTWRPKGFRSAEGASEFVQNYNSTAEVQYYDAVLAEWEYNTNINDQTQAAAGAASQRLAQFQAEQAVLAKQFNPDEIEDPTDSRLMRKISDVGKGALSDDDLQELTDVNSRMQTTYSTAQVCLTEGDACLPLDPDLSNIMATSRDYNELREVWKGWREESGNKMRSDYNRYTELNNEVATLNDYPDNGAYWLSAYETPDIEQQLEAMWQEMLPLYEQLHAYARRKLYNYYGDTVINLKGPIPAHLLGNMWAQSWINIYDLLEPYPGKVRPDATPGMIEKGWDVMTMFQVADDFFRDMGLIKVPQEFWDETMYERPENREVVCHASAWDFYNRKDFRIKMCTQVNQDDFVTVHHELGHIQYYLQYQIQPVSFRDGANPGFHEAVGDTLALSVGTLDHLYKLGLIEEPSNDAESDINYLMSVALDKISFIPFGYLMDKWRWDVFSGRISSENLNQGWWDYRLKYQGVAPPTPRTEMDFDPGSKFHIPNDVPYIRYFVSVIVQFQFYEALCNEAGHTGDLFKCDFNGTFSAGQKLGDMLKLGSSLPWEDALERLTGSREMSSASLVRYFQPLLDFLEQENTRNGDNPGWPDYSWQPPTNTVQDADGKVRTDNGAKQLSGTLTLLICAVFAAFSFTMK